MRVRTVKRTDPRVDTPDINSLDIQSYGHDNLYPQRCRQIIAASSTGSKCLADYAKFIKGEGFTNLSLYKIPVNVSGDTMDDLLEMIADDYSAHGGFALHFNFNILGQITSMRHVPFEHCRLSQLDDFGNVKQIAVFPNWANDKKYGGSVLKASLETVDYIDVFNPDPTVLQNAIAECGSIEAYKGQVLYVSNTHGLSYPVPIFDSAITELSTDEGLANVSYRDVRFSFMPGGFFVSRKSSGLGGVISPNGEERVNENSPIESAIRDLQGDVNSGKIAWIEIESDDEKPEFMPIDIKTNDDRFLNCSSKTTERIYGIFGQDVFYRIRTGSLGFSSDIISDAFAYYNTFVRNEQRMIERVFEKIAKYFVSDLGNDFTVKPLSYGATNNMQSSQRHPVRA